jgi:hypothetical protein
MKKIKTKNITPKNIKRVPDRSHHLSWGMEDVVEIKPTKRAARRK